MKKTLLTALVICASVCAAFAQNTKTQTTATAPVVTETAQKSAEVKQAKDWQAVMTELKLSDEQVKKIDEMNKAFGEREKAIEGNADLTSEVKAERKAMLKKAQEAQFMRILTPEQQAKYKELMEPKK